MDLPALVYDFLHYYNPI